MSRLSIAGTIMHDHTLAHLPGELGAAAADTPADAAEDDDAEEQAAAAPPLPPPRGRPGFLLPSSGSPADAPASAPAVEGSDAGRDVAEEEEEEDEAAAIDRGTRAAPAAAAACCCCCCCAAISSAATFSWCSRCTPTTLTMRPSTPLSMVRNTAFQKGVPSFL